MPNPPQPQVAAAKVLHTGLFVLVDDRWGREESKPALLEAGLCLLINQEATAGYFADNYSARWPGDPADNAGPLILEGGTDSPVVAALMENWVALLPVGGRLLPIPLPVPTEAQAVRDPPGLRAARHRWDLVAV